MRRGSSPTFGLAFLDIMFCGFGAVVLLVMLLHGKTLQVRDERIRDSSEHVERAEILYENAQEHLRRLRREVESIELEQGALAIEAGELRDRIAARTASVAQADRLARGQARKIEALRRKKQSLENATSLLKAEPTATQTGRSQVGFDGEGKRQYLTGLKLGGRRTLILLDASASMLDETVVNVIRRKIMAPSVRRNAPKWKRVVRSFHWLVSNLPADRQFQAYSFDTEVRALIPGSEGKWLGTDRPADLQRVIAAARKLAPQRGTDLEKAFAAIKRLSPRPDSVILLTDGLPTQGTGAASSGTISGEKRRELYRRAVDALPPGVPINTLLFPLEGDPLAAVSYWQLAIDTRGSFITPSRNWP